jgi:hypothetical protein
MEVAQPSAEMDARAAALDQEVTLFCRFDPHNREQHALRHGLEVWWPPTSSTAVGSPYQAAFGGGQVAEGRVAEAGRIHHAPAGEFVDDLVDELDPGGRVGAFGEEFGEQPLGGIAIEPTRERMNSPKPSHSSRAHAITRSAPMPSLSRKRSSSPAQIRGHGHR